MHTEMELWSRIWQTKKQFLSLLIAPEFFNHTLFLVWVAWQIQMIHLSLNFHNPQGVLVF